MRYLKKALFFVIACSLFLISCKKNNEKPNQIDIVSSSYTATGEPLSGVSNPSPETWEGDLLVINDLGDPYFSITNWANIHYPVYLKCEEGKIYIDGTTVLFEYEELYWCLGVGYYKDGALFAQPASTKYEVTYNKKTKTLDFTGLVSGNKAVVGLVGRNKITGNAESFLGDTFYYGAILTLIQNNAKSVISKSANELQNNEKTLKSTKVIENYSPEFQKIEMKNVKYFYNFFNP